MEYIPIELIVIFIILCICAVISITCFIMDTYMNVKQHKHWKKWVEQQELDKQVGEIVEAKINPGGGI